MFEFAANTAFVSTFLMSEPSRALRSAKRYNAISRSFIGVVKCNGRSMLNIASRKRSRFLHHAIHTSQFRTIRCKPKFSISSNGLIFHLLAPSIGMNSGRQHSLVHIFASHPINGAHRSTICNISRPTALISLVCERTRGYFFLPSLSWRYLIQHLYVTIREAVQSIHWVSSFFCLTVSWPKLPASGSVGISGWNKNRM